MTSTKHATMAAAMSYPQSTPDVTRWCMLIVSVVCLVAAICAAAPLVEAERTGIASYYPDIAVPATERVTRAKDPGLFQQAMLQSAFPVILAGSVSAVAFHFFRRLSS